MSIWGTAPFQDDSSLDYLDETIESHCKLITGMLDREHAWTGDLYFFRSVGDLLLHICKKYGPGPMSKEVVAHWARRSESIAVAARMKNEIQPMDEELLVVLRKLIKELSKLTRS